MPSDLYARIYAEVSRVPRGFVSSYGDIAKRCGLFRGARIVGWALKALPAESGVPWQRIVNQQGVVSIVNPRVPASLQAQLLGEEGVEVTESEGRLVLKQPPWWRPEGEERESAPTS